MQKSKLSQLFAGLEVLNRFEQYAWPGNVRELEHVIEGAMNLVTDENSIGMQHISVPLPVEMPEQDPMSTTINTGPATNSGLLTTKPAKPENLKACRAV